MMIVIMIMMMMAVFPQPSSVMLDSLPVPIYLLFKDDEGLRRNNLILKTGMHAKKKYEKVLTYLDAMCSHQILLSSDWERV